MNHENNDSHNKEGKKRCGYKASIKRSMVAGVLCALIIAVILILMTPIFEVKTFEINGNTINADNTIISASSIKKGESIFSLDTQKAEHGIMQLKNVASVKVSRSLPSKVIISVEETVEVAYVPVGSPVSSEGSSDESKDNKKNSDGSPDSEKPGLSDRISVQWDKYAGIDENARVISIVEKPSFLIPVITGVEVTDVEKGQFLRISDEAYAKEKSELIYSILTELKKQDIIAKIKEINLSDVKNIYMILDTDTLVNFGEDGEEDGNNIEYKIAFLKPILAEPRQNGGVIELSDTDNVTERADR